MPRDEKRLGRGLSSLISPSLAKPSEPEQPAEPPSAQPEPASNTAEGGTSDNIPVQEHYRGEQLTYADPDATQLTETRTVASSTAATLDRPVLLETHADHGDPIETRMNADTPAIQPDAPLTGMPTSLPTERIVANANQPRQAFNAASIAGLAASLARSGVVQPIVVRPVDPAPGSDPTETQYEIIAGERRWRAAKAAGLDQVPVLVRDMADQDALELALIENIQREDLNAIDRARAYRRYCDSFGVAPEALATRLGEDRTTVVNYLRLLGLPPEVKDWVAKGSLSMGHARALLGVESDQARIDLARATMTNGLSVRALEERVRKHKSTENTEAEAPSRTVPAKAVHVADLEERLQRVVGTKVTIREGRRKGTGKLMIEYYSLDDFDRIAQLLGLRDE